MAEKNCVCIVGGRVSNRENLGRLATEVKDRNNFVQHTLYEVIRRHNIYEQLQFDLVHNNFN